MTDPLQKFGWKKSSYERPSDKWVCGQLCDGTPCEFGPTSRGRCQNSSNQCQPKRSLLQRRRIATMSVAALSLAACLLLWSGRSTNAISPGEISSHHASAEIGCSACHSAASHDWTGFVFTSGTSLEDSSLCLKCHTELGENPLQTHGISPELIASFTEKNSSPSDLNPTLFQTVTAKLAAGHSQQEHACSECHREHHGIQNNLQEFANNKCQSCHADQFHSFESGHPDLGDYPHHRQTRIHFDHASHLSRYFVDDATRLMPDALPPSDCSACHQQSQDGRVMLTRGFEQMCSACHERGIKDRDFPGIPFISLPSAPSSEIGEWPAQSLDTAVRNMPGFMKLLLQSGETDDNESFWEVKKLFYDVARRGQSAIAERLPPELKAFGKLEPSIVPAFVHAQQLWFPNLKQEFIQRESGNPLPEIAKTKQSLKLFPPESEVGGGWYVRNKDHTIRYRPIGHADPVVRQWLEASVENWENRKGNIESNPVLEMLEVLANPTASGSENTKGPVASGRCFACHQIERDSVSSQWKINWSSKVPKQQSNSLTRFSHAPHLLTSEKKNCSSCHSLSENARNISTYQFDLQTLFGSHEDWETDFPSGFSSITKMTCAKCHNSSQKLNSCTQCHQYHAKTDSHFHP